MFEAVSPYRQWETNLGSSCEFTGERLAVACLGAWRFSVDFIGEPLPCFGSVTVVNENVGGRASNTRNGKLDSANPLFWPVLCQQYMCETLVVPNLCLKLGSTDSCHSITRLLFVYI